MRNSKSKSLNGRCDDEDEVGTCKPEQSKLWINLELAKKPRECLEYIVVHEMIHLLERNHTERFYALQDRYLPNWRALREVLNRQPLADEGWSGWQAS